MHGIQYKIFFESAFLWLKNYIYPIYSMCRKSCILQEICPCCSQDPRKTFWRSEGGGGPAGYGLFQSNTYWLVLTASLTVLDPKAVQGKAHWTTTPSNHCALHTTCSCRASIQTVNLKIYCLTLFNLSYISDTSGWVESQLINYPLLLTHLRIWWRRWSWPGRPDLPHSFSGDRSRTHSPSPCSIPTHHTTWPN